MVSQNLNPVQSENLFLFCQPITSPWSSVWTFHYANFHGKGRRGRSCVGDPPKRLVLLFSSKAIHVMGKTQVGDCSAFDPDFSFVIFRCVNRTSLQKDVEKSR